MAVIALFAVGSLIGGYIGGGVAIAATIGGMVGGLAGGYIDSQYTFPALFGKDSNAVGPRMGDLSVQSASEGSPIRRCYGRNNKIAGTIIWMSDLIETRVTEHVDGGGKGGPSMTSTTFQYSVNLAIAICAGEIDSVSLIMADSKPIYTAADGKDHRTTSITLYTGSNTQLPNSLMEAALGAGNVPGYIGTAYVVIEGLQLADWGNRVPNMQFDVRASASDAQLADVISAILEEAGLTTDDYDVSNVPALVVRGFTLNNPMQARAPIETLMATYNLYVQMVNGKMAFFQRGHEDEITIDVDDLAAHVADDNTPQAVTFSDTPGFDLPSETTVTYIDLDTHMQSGLQRARRVNFVTDGVNAIDLPIVLTSTQARQIAERRLWTAWAERQTMMVSLPPKYFHVLEGDWIQVTEGGETFTGRVVSIDRGANFIHQMKAVIVQSQTADSDATGEDGVYDAPGLYLPPPVSLFLWDGPAIRETDINTPVYYWAMAATDSADTWAGGSLWAAHDDATFGLVGPTSIEGTVGKALSALGVGGAAADVWDEENSVDIELYNGSISDVTREECLNGSNRAFLGGELIGFTGAEDLGGNTFRLTGLLRGLRDTLLTGHAIDEGVLVLSPTTAVKAGSYTSAQIGTTDYFRAAAVGDDVLGLTSQAVTYAGGSVRCFSPAQLNAERDFVTNDWTLSWFRRTRAWTRLFQETPEPLEEATEVYSVDIMDGVDIVRTISVSATTETTYTSAMQTTDFGAPQTALTIRVYQVGAVLGRGRKAEGTF